MKEKLAIKKTHIPKKLSNKLNIDIVCLKEEDVVVYVCSASNPCYLSTFTLYTKASFVYDVIKKNFPDLYNMTDTNKFQT